MIHFLSQILTLMKIKGANASQGICVSVNEMVQHLAKQQTIIGGSPSQNEVDMIFDTLLEENVVVEMTRK
jgi:hypothetical protein